MSQHEEQVRTVVFEQEALFHLRRDTPLNKLRVVLAEEIERIQAPTDPPCVFSSLRREFEAVDRIMSAARTLGLAK